MLRTRILAAATAAVLMLGMSVGGAGAALALQPPTLDSSFDGATTPTEECVPHDAIPEILEESYLAYQRYSWTGGPTDGAPTEVPPSDNWQANTTNYEGAGHGTDPIGVPIQTGPPGNANWFFWTATKVVTQEYVPGVPAVTCPDPEPEPTTVTARVTFICKVTTAGMVTNAPGTYAAGDYIFRIRHEAGPATDYTAGVGGAGLFSGNLTVGEVEFKATPTAVAGVSIETSPLPNEYNGTASTNETACGTPAPTPIYEVALYLYKKLDPDAPASWPNSGPQTFIDSQLGTEWFTEFPEVLPENVCGEGWAVQQDKVSHTGGFTWPSTIEYPDDNIGWPPIYAARHDNLETYLEVPDCEPPTLPTINVTASSINLACDGVDGSFTVGLGIEEGNGDKLIWTTSAPGDPTLPGTVSVGDEGVVTVTVDVLDEFAAEYGLNDESGLGDVNEDTGAITFTFTFTEPDDCPTLEGSTASGECDQDAPYLEWTIDLSDAGEYITFPTDATLTLRSKTDPSKFYTFPAFELTGTGASSGSALWPGAEVDDEGNGTAWPGWAFVDGEWVIDDSNYGWVRGNDVELFIQVNPEIAVDVSYPSATPDCANPPVTVPQIDVVDICVPGNREFIQTATFTVKKADYLTYSYTVNGGEPNDIEFPEGETEITIAVDPLDEVEVTATPAEGFRLEDDYEPWSYSFIGAAFCLGTFPSTVADAELVLPDCLGNPGRVVLSNEGGVIWTLNAEVVEGNSSYDITPGTQVELTAALEGPSDEFPGGWTWNDEDQQTVWSEFFPVAEECGELETLALTGAGAFTNWLGVAAVLMMVAGMGFVVRRNRVEV